jgi:hypothetical protein
MPAQHQGQFYGAHKVTIVGATADGRPVTIRFDADAVALTDDNLSLAELRESEHVLRVAADTVARAIAELTAVDEGRVISIAAALHAEFDVPDDTLYDYLDIADHSGTAVGVQQGTRVLRTHGAEYCSGEFCCIHKPSDHALHAAPMNWRSDNGLMERICEHGVGHPDPDDLTHKLLTLGAEGFAAGEYDVHGCDGCCALTALTVDENAMIDAAIADNLRGFQHLDDDIRKLDDDGV